MNPVRVTVKSQTNSGFAHFPDLVPGKWPPKVRELAAVCTIRGTRVIKNFDRLTGEEPGTKKEIERDAKLTRDGPGRQINVGESVVEGDQD